MGFKKRWGLETSDHLLSLAWFENGLIVTPSTGTILLVDQDGKVIADSLEIASVCGGGARMWRMAETEPFARFDWGGASLLVVWSPDGRWIVTGDQTPSVHLYDFTRDYPLHIQGYETKVKAMDFSPDGRRLATGGGTTVTVWNCTGKSGPEGTIPDQLKFHKGDVEAVAWSPAGEFLATGDIAGRLVFSDTKGQPVSAFEDTEAISALAWSPDGKCLAAGDAGGRVVLFSD
jgi:WD40 repeat protein